MKNLNIVFTAPNTAQLVERDIGAPEGRGVLVRVERDTISSGTERANLVGDPANSWQSSDPVAHFPRQCGYSTSGVVEAVGPDVASVRPGDRVAVSWSVHAQYVAVPEERVYRLPDGVSFEAAALVHIATFPMAAIRKCRLEMGESAIVMGQGVLGMLAVALLRAAGAAPVIAADPDAAKREKALRLGADEAVDPAAADFARRVRALAGGGVNVAIEVTGNDRALDSALDVMARLGRVALLGCTRHSSFAIDYYRKVHGPGVSLIGAHTMARPGRDSSAGLWTERDDALALIRMLALGRLPLDGFVDEVRPPSEAEEVFGRLARGGAFPVVQFDWSALRRP